MLYLLQGPAGGGKSGRYRELLNDNLIQVVADFTVIWAALGQHTRDPETGLYAVRQASDPLVRTGIVAYIQAAITRQALRVDLSVAVTTSQAGQEDRWSALAAQEGADFRVETIDPGRQVVTERLAAQNNGSLRPECLTAINRWYNG